MRTPGRRGGLIAGLHWPTCRDKETVKFIVQKGLPDPLQRYVDKAGLDDIQLQHFRAKTAGDAKKQDHDPEVLVTQGTEARYTICAIGNSAGIRSEVYTIKNNILEDNTVTH